MCIYIYIFDVDVCLWFLLASTRLHFCVRRTQEHLFSFFQKNGHFARYGITLANFLSSIIIGILSGRIVVGT